MTLGNFSDMKPKTDKNVALFSSVLQLTKARGGWGVGGAVRHNSNHWLIHHEDETQSHAIKKVHVSSFIRLRRSAKKLLKLTPSAHVGKAKCYRERRRGGKRRREEEGGGGNEPRRKWH